MAARGPPVEGMKEGPGRPKGGTGGHPQDRRMGPPAAEGRPWGCLDLRGGPEATHPRGRRREGRRGETMVRVEDKIVGESDRAWSSKELGARCPSTREQARADTHVQVRPRAHARASPRGAGDERGGQGGGTNAVAADGVAHQAGRRRPGCSRMGDDRARCRAGQAGVCVCTALSHFFSRDRDHRTLLHRFTLLYSVLSTTRGRATPPDRLPLPKRQPLARHAAACRRAGRRLQPLGRSTCGQRSGRKTRGTSWWECAEARATFPRRHRRPEACAAWSAPRRAGIRRALLCSPFA